MPNPGFKVIIVMLTNIQTFSFEIIKSINLRYIFKITRPTLQKYDILKMPFSLCPATYLLKAGSKNQAKRTLRWGLFVYLLVRFSVKSISEGGSVAK